MARRPYDNTLRKEAEADTVRRIVAATVDLHAQKGGMATSHADIAERAGVSVATVYKHFPTRETLLPHCIGSVSASAPPLDAAQLLAIRNRKQRLAAFVEALHARYRYFHPWMRWTPRDAPALPALAKFAEAGEKELGTLIRTVLESWAGGPLPQETLTLAKVLLGYPAWQRVESELRDPERAGRAVEQAVQLLISKATTARNKDD
ncbi:TetR/AcrR family transcriptional regulator [Oxalobacteraceae bacterium OM1]|nr:TetR/AcrR family transcriptional regulator [Oxalobacteraceae bacterium OM1]